MLVHVCVCVHVSLYTHARIRVYSMSRRTHAQLEHRRVLQQATKSGGDAAVEDVEEPAAATGAQLKQCGGPRLGAALEINAPLYVEPQSCLTTRGAHVISSQQSTSHIHSSRKLRGGGAASTSK